MKKTFAKLRWGILGTGRIAQSLAHAIAASRTSELVAVGSRTREAAEKFRAAFRVPRCYASYAEVLADKRVQAVYISLPNHLHAPWAILCAEAGKHILCEKPLTSNHAQAMAVIEAVKRHKVFLMEAFMYRCHPQTARLVQLVKQKVIGEVRLIQANFSFNFGNQPENIRSQSSTSGGSIMDVGCYTMSLARLLAGAALGLDGPAEPLQIRGSGHLDPRGGVDMWAVAAVKFPNDILATLTCGMQVQVSAPTFIWGTRGHIVVPQPWFPGETPDAARIEVHRDGESAPQIITVPGLRGLYTIEVDTVAAHLARRQATPPAMTWADSLGNMRALDAWRSEVGVSFDCEKPEGLALPLPGRPLRKRAGVKLAEGKIAGVPKPVARLVLGTMGHVVGDLPKACVMLDYFFESGGNCLDTARVYGTEPLIGQWLKLRGVRDQMVLIGKAVDRVDLCTPEEVSRQLLQTLERMQVESFDLFLMHRDNPAVPVGEFVEMLNEHKRAGRFAAFGGSNWSIERLQAANDYARAHKLAPFAASSPHFSLAHWNEPMWAGCIAAVDAASVQWYTKTQMPLLAWSSQANGFFSGRFTEAERNNPAFREMVRVWYNKGNFERLRRAQQLAAKKGVTAIQISLAYVLAQRMNMFALIGPQTLEEMQSSLDAAAIRLTPKETAWLNLAAARL